MSRVESHSGSSTLRLLNGTIREFRWRKYNKELGTGTHSTRRGPRARETSNVSATPLAQLSEMIGMQQ